MCSSCKLPNKPAYSCKLVVLRASLPWLLAAQIADALPVCGAMRACACHCVTFGLVYVSVSRQTSSMQTALLDITRERKISSQDHKDESACGQQGLQTSLVNASDTCKQLLQQSKVMSQQQGADRADRQERQRIDDERYAKDRKQQQDMFEQIMGVFHNVMSQP